MNTKIFWFVLDSLSRRKYKNLSIFIIFTLIIALLSSIMLISSSIKKELFITLDELPDITVQKISAGRQTMLPVDMVSGILDIPGVKSAKERVWGYYYFANAGVNFTVIGIDLFDYSYKKSIAMAIDEFDISLYENMDFMITGEGVKKTLASNYYDKYFNFILPSGELKKIYLASTFKSESSMESNDVILMPVGLAREVLEADDKLATDIVVNVANPNEIAVVAKKVTELYPYTRVITKKDIENSYQNIFDYKSGIFLSLFITTFFAFFILVFEKASAFGASEKKEIGILKALGWKIDDVLRLKLMESSAIALFSFAAGLSIAAGYVYILNAPILINVFTGFSVLKPSFELPVAIDIYQAGIIFIFTVPLYIAAVIIPAWRAAVIDAGEMMR